VRDSWKVCFNSREPWIFDFNSRELCTTPPLSDPHCFICDTLVSHCAAKLRDCCHMLKRKVTGHSLSEACNRQREETNRRVMRIILVVVLAFLLCWSLYFVLMVLRKNGVHVSCDVLYLRLLLAPFNAGSLPGWKCILVLRDKLILFSVKRKIRKLFIVTRDQKI